MAIKKQADSAGVASAIFLDQKIALEKENKRLKKLQVRQHMGGGEGDMADGTGNEGFKRGAQVEGAVLDKGGREALEREQQANAKLQETIKRLNQELQQTSSASALIKADHLVQDKKITALTNANKQLEQKLADFQMFFPDSASTAKEKKGAKSE